MRWRVITFLVCAAWMATGTIIDRIAIVVGATEGTRRSIVKDSDIDRDIRVTSFLNDEPLNFSNAARKKAADRLIDQIFIRREIEQGDYPGATFQQADQQLGGLEKQRFKTQAAFEAGLSKYGLTNADLRTAFVWQLTILRFIDIRFKPAVIVNDDEIEKYYRNHAAALRREHPGKSSLDDLREQIRDILAGERVNQQLFAWLDEQRKSSKIQFLEESLA
ncbi:MAG: hypothetical protein WB992_02220 [Bryobacteraceae bacterium]